MQEELLKHKSTLQARLNDLEIEKSQVLRKIKAVDTLLEGYEPQPLKKGTYPMHNEGSVPAEKPKALIPGLPPHTVRHSPRSTLIGAVQQLASKQSAEFTSLDILDALKSEYPEFNVTETKHVSSQLSDLVKRKVLQVRRQPNGGLPNIYTFIGERSKE